MANSNNICTRFINYLAVLILAFLSSSVFALGGSFGGGGASGDWGESCEPTVYTYIVGSYSSTSAQGACDAWFAVSSGWGSVRPSVTAEMSSKTSGYCKLYGGSNNYTGNVAATIRTTSQEQDCSCPDGYERSSSGQCVPKSCPTGQTLVNGQCKTKTCPAGQALDASGNCMPADDACPAGQEMVNGRCRAKDDDDDNDDDDDQEKEWPAFCEWAKTMCQWYDDWKDWSNDYAGNEQKAAQDRADLKDKADQLKESAVLTNQKLDDLNDKLDQTKYSLDEIRDQDSAFYDEIRDFLKNYDGSTTPEEEYPIVDWPAFCTWSVSVCNWYLDWKDWRNDYNANTQVQLEKQDQVIENQETMIEQNRSFFEKAQDFFDETLSFFDEIRDFLAQQGNDADDDPSGEITPEQQDIQVDETQRITFIKGCPDGEKFTVSFMGNTQNLEFSYQPLCQFMSMIRPFVIAIAYLIAAYIVMGLSRGSSE